MLTAIGCPKCKVRLQAPDKLLGKIIHCPRCKVPVRLGPRRNGTPTAPPLPPIDEPMVPEEELAATEDPALETQLANDDADFIAGLEQIEAEAPPESPAESEAAAESAPPDQADEAFEQAFQDEAAAETVDEPAAVDDVIDEEAVEEDAPAEEALEEEAPPEEALEEEAPAEEAVEEKAPAEEAVEEEAVEEEAVKKEPPAKKGVTEKPAKKKKGDAKEDEPPEGLSAEVEKFMSANLFFLKGQSGIFSLNAAWDFQDPKTKKKIGSAVERPEGIMQALRFFLRRNWLPSKIEIREETTNELIFVVKRPSYFFNCTLEVRDANNKLLAKFTYKPLSRLVGKPMPVERKGGEKFATCEFYWLKGRVDLMDDNKKELANLQTESAYTKAIKIYWAPRGGSYYVTFNKPLSDKPYDKMIFLGVALALDLLQEDSKAGAGKGGISIGT
jgi:hypothetical protein